MNYFHKKAIIFVSLSALLAGPLSFAQAQTDPATDLATKQQLEKDLAEVERQIAALETELNQTQGEKKTLSAKIKRLKTEESAIRLQINSTNLKIRDIEKKLGVTQKELTVTKTKSDRLKGQLSEVLRLMNRKDQELLLESLAADDGLAEVAQNLQSYSKMFFLLSNIVQETKATNESLQKQQVAYENQEDDARQLLAIKSAQQVELTNHLAEQKELLQETEGKESNFQQMLADTRKRAAEIRSRIYETVGGNTQINFEQAVEIATWVSRQTGIRVPFLLAILTQESNLGKNVGTCNRAGDPPEKSWQVVMKPERDHEPFKTITEELGLPIDSTPVSCPLTRNGKPYGWGGAMGPAQFIPSTWMGYRGKVKAITGKAANPWDIRDAMLASAIKLRADGADGTDNGEWKAAMRYFSGGTNVKYRFYGDNVLKTTAKYEIEIEAIQTASAGSL